VLHISPGDEDFGGGEKRSDSFGLGLTWQSDSLITAKDQVRGFECTKSSQTEGSLRLSRRLIDLASFGL
jgi:hypothetical protein